MTRPGSPARSQSPPAKGKTTRQCRAGRGGRFGDSSARKQYYFQKAVEVALLPLPFPFVSFFCLPSFIFSWSLFFVDAFS